MPVDEATASAIVGPRTQSRVGVRRFIVASCPVASCHQSHVLTRRLSHGARPRLRRHPEIRALTLTSGQADINSSLVGSGFSGRRN